MRKKSDPNPQHARLPCGRKAKIQSIEGETARVMQLGGRRMEACLSVRSPSSSELEPVPSGTRP